MNTNRLSQSLVFEMAIPATAFSPAGTAEAFREALFDFSSSNHGSSMVRTALEQLPRRSDSVIILEVKLVSCPREVYAETDTAESWPISSSETKASPYS